MLRLRSSTPPAYAEVALADWDRTLVDHAHCEHKAAVTALSFVSKYPDDPVLVVKLAGLAREEAGHFARLAEVCTARGLALGHPDPDPYVQQLLAHLRRTPLEHRVDRLLACALIEGRSCERLRMLAQALAVREDPLASLYDELWREEAGHHTLFIELAERSLVLHASLDATAARAAITARLDELSRHEAEIVERLPLRPAIH